MLYLFKFGAAWLMPPGIFVLMLFALSLFACYRGERFWARSMALLCALLYLSASPLVSERLMGYLEGTYMPPHDPQGDAIIMLGGGAFSDVPDVDGEGALTSEPSARLLTVARLYRKLQVPILVSGGKVFQESGEEANLAKRDLISLGVPKDAIIVEDKSQNTRENAAFSARLLRERGLIHPILVTSAFHMRRSVLNYQKEGIDVVPYPTAYRASRHPIFHYVKLAPDSDSLDDNVLFMREILRAWVTRIFE